MSLPSIRGIAAAPTYSRPTISTILGRSAISCSRWCPDGYRLACVLVGGGQVADATLEVMTVGDVAQYLRIPASSVYKLAQDGRIPCRKVGRQWRFFRQAIDEWLGKRGPAGFGAEAGMQEAR